MPGSSKRALCIFLFLFVVVAGPAAAQKFTGDVSGTVTDATGAALAGATVSAESVGTGLVRTATTSDTGTYRIPNLTAGRYKVSVSASGFKTALEESEVTANGIATVDFSMQVGSATERVEVSGEAPLVDMSVNQNSTLDSARIESVPLNGRDFSSLVALAPGVQRAPGGGFLAITVNGTRPTSANNLVDGLYNNDRFYGQPVIGQTGVLGIPATLFPMEALQELNVQETPSAEFAVKGGAPISLVMKSGTNHWHGSALFSRHTSFADAANFFAKQGTCLPNCTTPFRNMQGTGTIGGPILKDKTFFFLYYDVQGYAAVIPHGGTVPTPTQVQSAESRIQAAGLSPTAAGQNLLAFFPAPTDPATGAISVRIPVLANMNNFGVRVDQKIGQKHQISARYIFGDSFQSAPPSEPNTTVVQAASPNKPDLFNSIAPTRGQLAGLSWTWAIHPNMYLESRLGLTRFSQIIDTNNKIDPNSLGIDTGPLAPADFALPYVHLAGFASIGGGGFLNYPIVTRPDQTVDWAEHFTLVHSNHTITFGGNVQHAYSNIQHDQNRTQFSFDGQNFDNNPVDELVQLLLGKPDGASRFFGNTRRHLTQNTLGLYVQDEWKIRPRLTLTLGLRYDLSGAVSETKDLASNFLPNSGLVQVGHGIGSLYGLDKKDFGPRLGFAWDIFGNGRTSLRGGYALAYDTPDMAAIALPFLFQLNNPGAFLQPNLGVTQVSLSGTASASPETGTCMNPTTGAPGDYVCIANGPVFGANPGGSPPFSAFSIVSPFRTPRFHTFNLGIQREVWRDNVVTITYSGQRGRKLILPIDINALPLGCGSAVNPCVRPFAAQDPTLSDILQLTNLGFSQYDSLQASFHQRNWHGINTQYNLTWSKCYDLNSLNRSAEPQLDNPLNIKDMRGLCDFDVRLNFNVGGIYSLPAIPHIGRFGTGWQVGTVYTALSGRPFSVFLPFDPSGQGFPFGAIRASWDGKSIAYQTRNPNQYVVETYTAANQPDPCGNVSPAGGLPLSPFYIACPGTVGNSPRNMLIGPGLSQWDASIIKDTRLTERMTLQFRWEVFNVLNRANFSQPSNFLIPGGNFGQITSTPDVGVGNPILGQGAQRNMDFVLKLIF